MLDFVGAVGAADGFAHLAGDQFAEGLGEMGDGVGAQPREQAGGGV